MLYGNTPNQKSKSKSKSKAKKKYKKRTGVKRGPYKKTKNKNSHIKTNQIVKE